MLLLRRLGDKGNDCLMAQMCCCRESHASKGGFDSSRRPAARRARARPAKLDPKKKGREAGRAPALVRDVSQPSTTLLGSMGRQNQNLDRCRQDLNLRPFREEMFI